jgi:C1A family cysteine protease
MPHASRTPLARNRKLKVLAGIAVFAMTGLAVEAQQLYPITLPIIEQQLVLQLISGLESYAVVNTFITQHPNLADFAQLAAAVPNNPQVSPTFDGNFRTTFVNDAGVTRIREFMGQVSTLGSMANAITTAASPAQQLAQYQSMYTKYGALYAQICTAPAPPAACFNLPQPAALTDPATLAGAPLSAIVGAEQSLGDVALNVLKIVPIGDLGALLCSAEIGASTTADNILFGDQTNSSSCTGATPSSAGILANFNWYNKNLLTCVREQGARGSCHIFGSTSAMEELIARDTGKYVNLSEQDFMENEKLIWGPAYYGDGGDAATDLGHAQSHGYRFAYEKQWDYNPSWSQPRPPAFEYVNSCENYPTTEPGCSNDAPQAPAVIMNATPFFTPAVLSGANSPYMSNGSISLWDPSNKDLPFDKMILALAFSEAVIWEFKVSNNFKHDAPGGYVTYSAADVSDTAHFLGGHVVHLVGFVSNEDLARNPKTASVTPDPKGLGYFIIKNSWGTCSGDAGYYYVPVAYLYAVTNDVLAVGSESH